jgi:hypothetical protein
MSLLQMNENVLYTIIYLSIFIVLIFYVKPHIMFKPNGKIRDFGFGYDSEGHKKTLYNLQFIIIVLAIFTYKIIPYTR